MVLQARDLVVARGSREILRRVEVDLAAGEAVALVGPNAVGKSTLVRTLAGLLAPRAGEVRLLGRPLGEWSREAVARVLALVTSLDEGPDTFTVRDRVALGRYPHCGPFRSLSGADEEAVLRALRLTEIEHLARRRLGTLSAGERQLATLACGLAQEPKVLLLDEPAAHLDVGHQLHLFRVLDEVRAKGVAVLAVVHDLQRAAAWAQRMWLLDRGQLTAQGTPAEVLGSPACAQAFGVAVHAHRIAGQAAPLYQFSEA